MIDKKETFKINEKWIKFGDRVRIMSNDKQMFYIYKQKRNDIIEIEKREEYERV